jgi:hypothetical protein
MSKVTGEMLGDVAPNVVGPRAAVAGYGKSLSRLAEFTRWITAPWILLAIASIIGVQILTGTEPFHPLDRALLFATGYVLTGELALPIGLHFAWDFVQGYVFGVTGGASQLGSFLVLAEDDPAAKLWTGFPYGVEGGPLATVAFILGFLLIAAWVRLRRGSVRLYPSLAQPPRQLRGA